MSQPSEFSRTDTQERPGKQLNSPTAPQQDDCPSSTSTRPKSLRYLFEAIRIVETGGHEDPRNARGDGGWSLGPYQISKAYWLDALQHDPSIGGCYDDVRDEQYAERIMLAYWSRYAPDMEPETLARIHNGGPKGHLRKSTDRYWNRLEGVLQTCELVGDWEKVGSDQAAGGGDTRPNDAQTRRPSFGRSIYQRLVGRK